MKLNGVILYSGVGYVMVFLLTPVLTRLYSPVQLGDFAVFGTCMMLVVPLLALGNDYGVINEKRLSQSKKYLNNIIVSTLVGFCGLYILLFIADQLFDLIDGGYKFLFLFPVAAVLAVLGGAGVNWNMRRSQDNIAGRSLLASLAGRSVIQVILGFLDFGIRGLILGEIIGRLISLYCLNKKFYIFRFEIKSKILYRLKNFRLNKYSKYVTPKIFIENFIIWSPSFLVALAYGPEFGGVLVIVQRLGSTPITIYNQAYGIIFHRALVLDVNFYPKRILKIVVINWLLLTVIASIVGYFLYFHSDNLSTLAFGENWSDVGYVFLLTIPMYLAQICAVLVDKMLIYFNHLKAKLLFNIMHSIVIILTLCVSYLLGYNGYYAIFIMSVLIAVSYTFSMIYSLILLLSYMESQTQKIN